MDTRHRESMLSLQSRHAFAVTDDSFFTQHRSAKACHPTLNVSFFRSIATFRCLFPFLLLLPQLLQPCQPFLRRLVGLFRCGGGRRGRPGLGVLWGGPARGGRGGGAAAWAVPAAAFSCYPPGGEGAGGVARQV